MKRKLVALLLALYSLLLAGCNTVVYEDTAQGLYAPPVPPHVDGIVSTQPVMLYYPVVGEAYVVGIEKNIVLPAGEQSADTLIKELIAQAPDAADLSGAVWEGVELVSTYVEGETVFVTLSREFLDPPAAQQEDGQRMMRNAIHCIVNTLTETGEYGMVQILVDKNGTRNGTRPKRGEVGFVGMGEEAALEPMIRKVEAVFTPRAAVSGLLTATSEQDWTRFKRLLLENENGASRPDEETLSQYAADTDMSVVGYNVADTVIASDGSSATASVDIRVRYGDGETVFTLYNKTISLVAEHGVWKVAFSSVESVLF